MIPSIKAFFDIRITLVREADGKFCNVDMCFVTITIIPTLTQCLLFHPFPAVANMNGMKDAVGCCIELIPI